MSTEHSRFISFPLRSMAGIGSAAPGTEQDYVAPAAQSMFMLPTHEGGTIYPLVGINQVILNWLLLDMPTSGSFCSMSPVNARGILGIGGERIFGTVPTGLTTPSPEIYRFTFDQLDTTNNRVNVFNYEIYKTVADALTVSITGTSAIDYSVGTRHAIAVADRYLAFWFQTDGDAGTGLQAVSVDLGWA